MSRSRLSQGAQRRIGVNQVYLDIERAAAFDLISASRAWAVGQLVDYVPLWKRITSVR